MQNAAATTNENERRATVRKLASVMCKGAGFDPDCKVTPHALKRGPKRSLVVSDADLVQAWTLYLDEAWAVLEEVERTA